MTDLLFHPPLWMPAAALLMGIVLFVYGNTRLIAGIRHAGLAAILLTLVWSVAAYFVDTPLEKCIARTRAIVSAVETADWAKLRANLDPETTLEMLRGRDDIASATEVAAQSYGLKSITILSTDPIQGVGSVDVNFTALLEGAQATTSRWNFQYVVRPDGITLTRILPVSIGQVSADQIRRNIRGK